MKNSALGSDWEEVEKKLFSPEEIAKSNFIVALIGEFIKARDEKGISIQQIEQMSGVKQQVIARMQKGYHSSQLENLLKVLASLGKTLEIVDLKK